MAIGFPPGWKVMGGNHWRTALPFVRWPCEGICGGNVTCCEVGFGEEEDIEELDTLNPAKTITRPRRELSLVPTLRVEHRFRRSVARASLKSSLSTSHPLAPQSGNYGILTQSAGTRTLDLSTRQ